MSKVVFLDFDGTITTLKSNWTIDNSKVDLVKQICDVTGAKIVISSSWRRYTLEQTIETITNQELVYGHNPFPYPEYIMTLLQECTVLNMEIKKNIMVYAVV